MNKKTAYLIPTLFALFFVMIPAVNAETTSISTGNQTITDSSDIKTTTNPTNQTSTGNEKHTYDKSVKEHKKMPAAKLVAKAKTTTGYPEIDSLRAEFVDTFLELKDAKKAGDRNLVKELRADLKDIRHDLRELRVQLGITR